jgi:hypothetical protein
MCLNKTHSKGYIGRNLSDEFPIHNGLKQGDALPPLLFNFAFEYVIITRSKKMRTDWLNATHQFLVYTDDVNISDKSQIPYKKNILKM